MTCQQVSSHELNSKGISEPLMAWFWVEVSRIQREEPVEQAGGGAGTLSPWWAHVSGAVPCPLLGPRYAAFR